MPTVMTGTNKHPSFKENKLDELQLTIHHSPFIGWFQISQDSKKYSQLKQSTTDFLNIYLM